MNPLNRVLEEFREWKQPTLMLVGNHDQVTLMKSSQSMLLSLDLTLGRSWKCPDLQARQEHTQGGLGFS